jgi:hypothetical protein
MIDIGIGPMPEIAVVAISLIAFGMALTVLSLIFLERAYAKAANNIAHASPMPAVKLPSNSRSTHALVLYTVSSTLKQLILRR